MKTKFVILLGTFILSLSPVNKSNAAIILYFYSPTCGECLLSGEFLDEIDQNHENFSIIKYDISTKEGMGLFNIYCDKYNVDEEYRYVPAIFIGKNALIGYKDISQSENDFDTMLKNTTPVYKYDESILSRNNSPASIKLLGTMLAGFINGLNPCSFAMFLFLFSLITLNKNAILRIAFAFLLAKFITFTLLGTVLFNFLSYINISFVSFIVKISLLVFILILITLNIFDYFSSKKNAYGKIRLQLPKNLRRYNHNLLNKVNRFLDSNKLLFIVFLISIGVSLTEFLCTGQIYLVTLVTLLQFSSEFNLTILLFLITYNIFLILPLLLTTIIIYKGKDIFSISEWVRENMATIKIINAAFLFIILLLIIFL